MSEYLTAAQTISECRKEAKKHGLTFKPSSVTIDSTKRYLYARRDTGEVVRNGMTLGTAYDIACSGELVNY
jgi:hypothetical protein